MAIQRDIRTRFLGEDRTGPATASATRRAKSLAGAYDTAARRIATANRLIASASLGIAGSNVLQTTANLQGAQARLAAVTKTLAADQAFLSRTAQKMSFDLEQAYTTMARLRVLESGGSIKQGNTEKILEGLGNAFARFGANAGQRENVIYGLAQALGQGQLQAQELNQVVEPLPGLLADIAAASGLTAVQYRNLTKEGAITSEMFQSDLVRAFATYEGTAERLSGNIQQTLTRMSNAYKELLQTFSQPISNNIGGLANAVTGILNTLERNADTVGKAVEIGLVAVLANYGTKALRSVNDFTTSYISSSNARRKAIFDEVKASSLKAKTDKLAAAQAIVEAKQQGIIAERTAKETQLKKQATAATRLESLEKKKQLALDKQKQLDAALQLKVEKQLARQKIVDSRAIAAAEARALVGEKEAALFRARTNAERKAAMAEIAKATQAYEVVSKRAIASNRQLEISERAVASAEAARLAGQAKVNAAIEKRAAAQVTLATIGTNLTKIDKRRDTLVGQLNRGNEQAAKAATALTAATAASTFALRKQQVATYVATKAMAGLRAAWAFIGGGVGAAILAGGAIAYFVQRLGKLSPEAQEAADAMNELTRRARAYRKEVQNTTDDPVNAALLTLIKQAQESQVKVNNELRKELALLKQKERALVNLGGYVDRAEQSLVSAKEAKAEEDRIEIIKKLTRATAAYAVERRNLGEIGNYASLQLTAEQVAAADKKRLTAAIAIGKEYDTQQNEIDSIKKDIETLTTKRAIALKLEASDEDLAIFDRALKEQRKKLADATGDTKKREEAEERVRELINDQNKILESTQTQEQKITDQLVEQLETLDKISKLPVSTVGRLSEAELAQTRVQLQNAANDALIKLDVDRHNNQVQLIEDRIAKELTLEAQKTQTLKQQFQELARQADPVGAARETNRQEFEVITAAMKQGWLDNEALREKIITDYRIRAEERIAQATADANLKANRKFAKVADAFDKYGGLTNDYLDALRPMVGGYEQITDQMSAAEKKAAEESNRANKRRFEKDKRIRKAAAIVDTMAGAARALAQGGWFGIAQAGAVILAGRKLVRGIEREKFEGTGGSGGSTIGSNRGQPGSDAVTTATNVIIIDSGSGGKAAAVARASGSLKELDAQLKSNNIAVSMNGLTISDAKYIRSKAG